MRLLEERDAIAVQRFERWQERDAGVELIARNFTEWLAIYLGWNRRMRQSYAISRTTKNDDV